MKAWSVPQQASDRFLPYRKTIKFSYHKRLFIITHLLKVFDGSRGAFFKKSPLRVPLEQICREVTVACIGEQDDDGFIFVFRA